MSVICFLQTGKRFEERVIGWDIHCYTTRWKLRERCVVRAWQGRLLDNKEPLVLGVVVRKR